MTKLKDPLVLMMSESGDWFLVPDSKSKDFLQDELDEDAGYAHYVGDTTRVKIYEFQIK